MKKKSSNSYFINICSILFYFNCACCAGEEESKKFNVKLAVAIIHNVEEGGIIYTRGNEYKKMAGFVIIYEAVSSYIEEIESSDMDFDLFYPSKKKEDEISLTIVVPGVEKEYFINSMLIGDGARWIPMMEKDYLKLTVFLSQRKKQDGSVTKDKDLAMFVDRLKARSMKYNTKEFDKHFSLDTSKTNKNVEDQDSTDLVDDFKIAHPEINEKKVDENSSEILGHNSGLDKTIKTPDSAVDKPKKVVTQNTQLDDDVSLRTNHKDDIPVYTKSSINEGKNYFFIKRLIIIALLFCLVLACSLIVIKNIKTR